MKAALAAADLALEADFNELAARLTALDAAKAKEVGILIVRPRIVVRGIGGLDRSYLTHFADVADAILTTYDGVFGFKEYSKVPGKKLRIRVHLEAKIERPPHFAPEFPFHSEVDFPVADAKALTSPTPDGKFLIYGLCHELGHVVAMWGNRTTEEDHHPLAHYTGIAIVESLTSDPKYKDLVKDLTDAKWRALSKEREAVKAAPSTKDKEGCMALWMALHDSVRPKAIGAAINLLDVKDRRLRVNQVRYYTFAELRSALLEVVKDEKSKKRLSDLLP